MLALFSMLHPTDYAKNYAGIMGAGLVKPSSDVESGVLWMTMFKRLFFFSFPVLR